MIRYLEFPDVDFCIDEGKLEIGINWKHGMAGEYVFLDKDELKKLIAFLNVNFPD